jgi:hypothetical protein
MRAKVAFALVLAVAVPALAGDDEVELKLLPKPKKGQAEEIAFEVQVAYEGETESLTGKMKREIKSVDEDGLPSAETLELINADYRHEQARSSYQTSAMGRGAQEVKRSGKARNASKSVCDLSHVTFKHVKDVTGALDRDPDALVRAIQPEDKMKVDDRWEVEPKDLLTHFVSSKAKVLDGSKAVATLEGLKKKDNKIEASIALKATIYYATVDDPDTKCRLTVTASLKGPIDGSSPPRKVKVDVATKQGDEKKLTLHLSFDRTPAEKDDDEETKKDEDETPKKKKPKKDEKEKAKEE